ncbi:non-ribosomal peptide synthetase [Nocardia donostiensis]|uniref:Phenyloxazoline synthase MbtB n=1 Tax=Nocardia donostiensis TaxID=1538463 RepID=A0A1V2T9X7_9NOCA|nr:non-ribosomal peptide synthetase [Nocardia donostiensis]ONM46307.1 non-ribosomal peptide synthetase [Nocardia donostiensis]OQS18572.1 non-ribosomal peptide synthetase [Nocardia donostiensis]
MNAKEIVAGLERAGVRLWADGDELRFRAPRGALTEERRDLLRANKSAVLDHLRAEDAAGTLVPDPGARYEPFPLTGIQTAYLLGRSRAHDYGGVACHAYVELAFASGTDPDRIRDAWRYLVHRHDMLRAVVHPDGYQQVLETVPDHQIELRDLRTATDADLARTLEDTRAELSRRVPDPGTWPLFALRLTHTSEALLLHLSIDLLVVDYASLQMLLAELEDLYEGVELTPLEVTFRDYVLGQRRRRGTASYDRDRDYWQSRLDELPPAPDLPVLAPAKDAGPFRRIETTLPEDAYAAFTDYARRHGLTPSSALLTAYAEVVRRWSGSPRFTLTLPTFSRLPLHPGVGALAGDFTSAELLAVDLTVSRVFADQAKALHATLLEDLAHPLFTGSDVLAELARRGRRAMMPVVFTSTLDVPGRTPKAEVRHAETQTPQVWLDCQVMTRGDALVLAWDVRDGVLPHGTPEDMFEAFVTLIHELAATPATWTRPAQIALPPRTDQVRQRVNATDVPTGHELLHEPVLTAAECTPDAIAVCSGAEVLTYRELLDRAYGVADALRANAVAPGDLVAIVLDKGLDQVVAVLGVLLAGAAYLPIDITQPALRRDRIRSAAKVRITLTSSHAADRPTGECLDIDTVAPSARRVRTPVDPGALAYVIYTSGSTGEPKGVMISHRAAANTIEDVDRRFGVTAADRVLAVAQLGFDLSVYDIFGPLWVGGAIVVPEQAHRGDPAAWADAIEGHGVTIWNSVPAQLQLLCDHLTATGRTLPSLRLALLSGDWIPLALPGQVRAVCPAVEPHSLGGATEAAIWSISYPIQEVDPGWRSIPYGTPLANQTWHVLDESLRPCPDWVTGELYIGGIGLADGYLGDEARTAERFVTCPRTGERRYRTGDLGRYHPDGVLELLGRKDNQVKIHGHRIELGEVEAALAAAPGVGTAVAIVDGTSGPGDAGAGLRLAAFVEPARRTDPLPAPPAVARAAEQALTAATTDLNADDVRAFMTAMDHAATLSIAGTLAPAFAGERRPTGDDIAAALGVPDRHRRLLDRWLAVLGAAGLVTSDNHGYRDLIVPESEATERAWVRAAELEREIDWSADLFAAVRACAADLPRVLTGVTPVESVLFADRPTEVLTAAYRDNLPVRVLHATLAATVRTLAAEHTGPSALRIMEIGARGGGAAAGVLPELADKAVDYLVTDSSPGQLAAARRLLAAHSNARFALFDLDRDPREQGCTPNSVDVVICAGTLNNAADAAAALRSLRELVVPGGWLLMLENTTDASAALQISTEFLDTHNRDFTDLRAGSGQTFLRPGQWTEILTGAGARIVAELPGAHSALATGGQQLFVTQWKTDREPVRLPELTAFVADRLPGYMTPAWWQVVDQLPVTTNGKVDRNRLTSWVTNEQSHEPAEPVDELEARLARLWAELLRIERVGRNDDIFALGADSLLVARFVGKLRDGLAGLDGPAEWDLEWEIVLRHLLRHPTVAGLATYLRAERTAAATRAEATSPVVELAGDGGEPITVLVHAGHGTMRPYSALLAQPDLRAPATGSVVGLEIASVADYLRADPASLIDTIATDYADALLAEGDTFHLIGYSVGGIIATEVARALTESGAEVRSLTVISSHTPTFHLDDQLLSEYSFAMMMGMDLERIGFPPDTARVGAAAAAVLRRTPEAIAEGSIADLTGEFADIAERFLELESVPRMRRIARMCEALPPELSGSLDPEAMLRALRVYQQSTAALSRHHVEPYAGDITFLRHAGSYEFPGDREAHTTHWERVCLGKLTVIDIPGDHFSCLSAAHIGEVADHIRRLTISKEVNA